MTGVDPQDAHRVSVVVAPEFAELRSFVQWGLDMQLADAAELLRLPHQDAGFGAGQNFTTATGLLNLIAGASVWCFDASLAGLSARGERSRRFRDLVTSFWPWDGEGVGAAGGVDVLYAYARNPLSHSAGLPGPEDHTLVRIVKSPLGVERIVELSAQDERPAWLGPAISATPRTVPGTAYDLSVPGMYWSVQRLLRKLLSDPEQAAPANEVAAATIRRLTDPNAPWRRPAGTGPQ